MRVPSIGLTPEERRIVREGYEVAEQLMRGYQDPPGLVTTWLIETRNWTVAVYNAVLRFQARR